MGILDDLGFGQTIDEKVYEKRLKALQLDLLSLQREIVDRRLKVAVGFEGPDAAGKGGAIKRLVERLDPRGVRVYPVSAPTPEEAAHHYLWRFWNRLPASGQIVIFDRTWYGRVLVERVERFAAKGAWQRAYDEIVSFERQLVDDGMVLVKYWLHIDKDEQLKRFKDREGDPYKGWKITKEDWRNRKHWDDYIEAAEEMFVRTSLAAPWRIIPANSKRHARIKVVEGFIQAVEAGMGKGRKK